jgi:hypothetical protein
MLLRWIALLLFATAAPSAALGQSGGWSFVAIGDMPYVDETSGATEAKVTDQFKKLIGAINRLGPAFTIHVGDITDGRGIRCTAQWDGKIHQLFGTFSSPLVYTPGDNEGTDCHRVDTRADQARQSAIQRDRLKAIRARFFDQIANRNGLVFERQRELVENLTWERDGVRFATMHVVGSNNNKPYYDDKRKKWYGDEKEHDERAVANSAWLSKLFTAAREPTAQVRAVVLALHANPFEPSLRGTGFDRLLEDLRAHVAAFAKPVLLIHGDTHVLRVGHPLRASSAPDAPSLRNLTRLEVFGAPTVNGVVISVSADPVAPFSFRAITE